MQVCGLTRILLPAAFAGIVISTFTQSELYGWIAAIATGLAVVAYQRITGRAATCAVPASPHESTPTDATANDDATTGLPITEPVGN